MRQVDYMVGGGDFKTMTAAQFMQSDVVFYLKSSKGDRIAMAMTMGGFGSVPIVDKERRLIGIVSEFDLLKEVRRGKELEKIMAGEVMTHDPIFVSQETTAEELMKILEDNHLIRVPVVNKEGKLVGVVARRDILMGYLRAKGEQRPWWL